MANDSKNNILDFAQLDTKTAADQGTFVHLENPGTGDLLFDENDEPIGIEILGADSAKVRAFERQSLKKNLDRARKRGSVEIDIEEVESNRYLKLATATLSWNLPPVDDTVLQCSEAQAVKFYSDERFTWVLEQLEKAMNDRRRFFTKPSAS